MAEIPLDTALHHDLRSAIGNYCGHPVNAAQVAQGDYSCDCDLILAAVWQTLLTHASINTGRCLPSSTTSVKS